jgi:hypothetical protein
VIWQSFITNNCWQFGVLVLLNIAGSLAIFYRKKLAGNLAFLYCSMFAGNLAFSFGEEKLVMP